jgi:hypothetical protein
MKGISKYLSLVLLAVTALSACTGVKTFTTAARPGETVALAIGRQDALKRANVTVTIKPATGSDVIYAPLDPRVRSILNLYPDPVSKAIVRQRTNNPTSIGMPIEQLITGGDPDWWQTFILLDLPTGIDQGTATISITDSLGAIIQPASVEVLAGASTRNPFGIRWFSSAFSVDSTAGPVLTAPADLERESQYVVDFAGDIIPHAVQIEFSHATGIGAAYVVNPRGDLKNVTWSDDGTNLKVIVTPTTGLTTTQIKDFKFYVTGGLTGLTRTNLMAYDQSGVRVNGVTATVIKH